MEPLTAATPDESDRLVFRRGLACVTIFACLLQAAALYSLRDGLKQDPDGYRTMAVIIRNTGVIGRGSIEELAPTAYRPPLYPLLLAGLVVDRELPLVAVAVLHLLFAAGAVIATARIGRLAGLPTSLALLAALVLACDPLLLNQSARIMTEPLATFLATLTILFLAHLGRNPTLRSAILAGAALGLASLCRPTFLPMIPLVIIILLWGAFRRSDAGRRYAPAAAAFLLASLVVLTPWTIRNSVRFGRPVFATTHGGYTLLLGNNKAFYDHLSQQPWGAVWNATALDAVVQRKKDEGLSEPELDAWAYQVAISTMRDNPGPFAHACLVRIGRLWNIAPHKTHSSESGRRRLMRIAVGVWYTGVFLLAGCGCWRQRRVLLSSPWVWGLTLCLCFTAVHTFYWSNLRMRAPLTPFVCLLAAAAFAPALTPNLRSQQASEAR